MERTVFKRETIQLKYLNKDKSSGSKDVKLPPVNGSLNNNST